MVADGACDGHFCTFARGASVYSCRKEGRYLESFTFVNHNEQIWMLDADELVNVECRTSHVESLVTPGSHAQRNCASTAMTLCTLKEFPVENPRLTGTI